MAVYGPTLAGGIAAATARYPRAPALIDDVGPLSYGDLWGATDGIARGLRDRSIGPGTTIGILARNGRCFVLSMVAAAKLGADVVYLNTGFAGPQLADVVAHEGIDAVLHDDVFADIVTGAKPRIAVPANELTALGEQRSFAPLRPTRHVGRQVILTSGTTGRPKGASRGAVRRHRHAHTTARDRPAPSPRHGRHCGAAVPRLGPLQHGRCPRDVVHGRAARSVRPGGDAGHRSPSTVPTA